LLHLRKILTPAVSGRPVDPALLSLTLRLVLAVLWLTAAAGKIRNLRQFAEDVREYRLLSPGVAEAWGRVLPFLELALGLSLLLGIGPRVAAAASALLLSVFTAALALAILRKLRIRCHCFGELGRAPVSWPAVGRNVLLAVAAVYVTLADRYWNLLGADGGSGQPSLQVVAPPLLICIGAILASHALFTAYSVFRVAHGRRPDDFMRF
jgi:hypothetical protein